MLADQEKRDGVIDRIRYNGDSSSYRLRASPAHIEGWIVQVGFPCRHRSAESEGRKKRLAIHHMKEITRKDSFDLGSMVLEDGRSAFRVWAPLHKRVDLHLHAPQEQLIPMQPAAGGYFEATVEVPTEGLHYTYRFDGKLDRPDPASRFQPAGVHGASALVDATFAWQASGWHGIPLSEYIFYEIHVGTFTKEGTFDAAIARIPYLKELGITAVEIMPVAQGPGERNWGYDGVYPYAVQRNYGGPLGLKRFVDACHLAGLAVVLDVVYNHLGPEGNYLRDFGPYFTSRYHTPWGEAINYDGADSGPVRHFFIQNALFWVTEYRIDALRLDATDTIYDHSPKHFLEELAEELHHRAEALNRHIYAVAESAANDVRWIRSAERGGYGLDAQWNDDYHHALRCAITDDRDGYYADYPGFPHLARSLSDGFVYQGEYSKYRRRTHGSPSADVPPSQFVVCCQNHDQIGNRMMGDRLGHKVALPKLKLAAAWVILSPYLPLLFMGEEYNDTAPFPYFVSHGDPQLVEAVREGRKREFAAFAWEGEPPDPQSEATFASARIRPELRSDGEHRNLFEFYRELIRIRKTLDPLSDLSRRGITVQSDQDRRTIWVQRKYKQKECILVFSFSETTQSSAFPFESGSFRKCLNSADELPSKPGSDSHPEFVWNRGEDVPLAAHAVLVVERRSTKGD